MYDSEESLEVEKALQSAREIIERHREQCGRQPLFLLCTTIQEGLELVHEIKEEIDSCFDEERKAELKKGVAILAGRLQGSLDLVMETLEEKK